MMKTVKIQDIDVCLFNSDMFLSYGYFVDKDHELTSGYYVYRTYKMRCWTLWMWATKSKSLLVEAIVYLMISMKMIWWVVRIRFTLDYYIYLTATIIRSKDFDSSPFMRLCSRWEILLKVALLVFFFWSYCGIQWVISLPNEVNLLVK